MQPYVAKGLQRACMFSSVILIESCFKWTKWCIMFNKGRKSQTAHLNLFIIYLDIMKNNRIIYKNKKKLHEK